jgi:hypothetical protein
MRFIPIFGCVAMAMLAGGCDFSFGLGSPDLGAGGAGGDQGILTNCGEEPSCPLSQPCLATVENDGKPVFGLRVAELAVSLPRSLSKGVTPSLLDALFGPNLPQCGLSGGGDSSWLLRFDLDHQTLTMGGAAPPAKAGQPFALLDVTVSQAGQVYHVAPVTFDLVASGGGLGTAAPQDFDLPMFFPGSGASLSGPEVLPIHALTASSVVVSPTHDCIGRYDPAVFSPEAGCTPTTIGENYVHAGHLEGYLVIEETDGVDVTDFDDTLCVLLSGNAAEYGDDSTGVTRCKRTHGVIDFQGDWCAATNSPATATCSDALRFSADFAASAATIQ